MDKEEQRSFMYGVPLTKAQKEYAANDLRYLPEIFQKQQAKIKVKELENIIDIEMKAIPALVWLELSGISVNLEKLELFKINAEKVRGEAQTKLFEILGTRGINLNSPIQLVKALNNIGVPVTSTKKEELAKYNHPAIDALEDYKRSEKLLNTFIKKMPEYINPVTGRIHAEYYQIGAVTGRISCKNPNMQQQPSRTQKNWKEIFVAGEGKQIVTADYSQIELRIVGQAAKDRKYIDAYNTLGVDLHRRTASTLFNIPENKVSDTQRSMAKSVNFGLNYGMWANGLVKRLKAEANVDITPEEAKSYAEGFQKMYPEVATYLENSSKEGLRNNCVRTMAGRLIEFEKTEITLERKLQEANERYKKTHNEDMSYLQKEKLRAEFKRSVRSSIGRQSKNYPIQGFCADLVKMAMARIFPILEPLGVKFIATVHDELVFECNRTQTEFVMEMVKKEMETAGAQYFPDIPRKVEAFSGDYWHK
jgi:DNA polymerase I-like protein with 3'-5' exonuclease and polymerase domains